MKKEISEWAQDNNLTPEQFKKELVHSFTALASMDLDNGNVKRIGYLVDDSKYSYEIVVTRTLL